MEVLVTLSYRQIECLVEFYQKSRSANGSLIDKDWEEFKKNSKYSETDINFVFKQLVRIGFINEEQNAWSLDGDHEGGVLEALHAALGDEHKGLSRSLCAGDACILMANAF